MRVFRFVLVGALVCGAGACTDPLTVNNDNNPDRNKALATAADLENFLAATYAIAHSGTVGSGTVAGGGANDGLQTQLITMGMENVSGLANFAMGPRSAIPRNPIDNTIGSQGNQGNLRDFTIEHQAARLATLALARLKALGSLGSAARDARARAFGKFVEGVGLGNLALAYDSAAIVTEDNTTVASVPLSGYADVMAAALANLDSAIAIAQVAPTASDGFPLPSTWINGLSLTAAQFVQLALSYKARLRAGVARTPADRAAVSWNAVIADANAGITADLNITMSPSNGWDVAWPIQHYATGSASWHQMSQFFMGMADVSGGYDTWLGTAPASRVPFVVVTPDKRLPQGPTRAAQNADSQPASFASTRYFRNRPPGEDAPGDPLQISMYDYRRSFGFFTANRNGPYPVMTAAEIRLLAAEGYLRTGNINLGAQLINVSRVAKGGLPPVNVLAVDTTAVVPGGAACVPKVPDPAQAYKKSKCGNMWDALKWEYRMETAYTGYGMWYFAGRGWGDLPEGTAIEWPTPYQELQVRTVSIYGLGGVGQIGGAARGNYGLFAGGVY
jgi:hypothetical protein